MVKASKLKALKKQGRKWREWLRRTNYGSSPNISYGRKANRTRHSGNM